MDEKNTFASGPDRGNVGELYQFASTRHPGIAAETPESRSFSAIPLCRSITYRPHGCGAGIPLAGMRRPTLGGFPPPGAREQCSGVKGGRAYK